MSNPEADGPDRQALSRLEEAVGAVLQCLQGMEGRLREAEERSRELESILERFRSGAEAPADVVRRAERLSDENGALRRRLDEGLEVVERIRARIRFLEEQE